MKLVIFDLDQTLVDLIEIHDRVTAKLFRDFFNVNARLTEIDFTGRSITENFQELARLKQVPEKVFKQKESLLADSYDRTFVESLPAKAEQYILPGVADLLESLAATKHITVLYTGSSRCITEAALKATGLAKYFKFCLYGTESKTRADMVKKAIEKAEGMTGRIFKDHDIAVIGDSVRDIECGKQFNALTIAVSTGFHSPAQLLEASPDHLLPDLRDYSRVIELIGSTVESR